MELISPWMPSLDPLLYLELDGWFQSLFKVPKKSCDEVFYIKEHLMEHCLEVSL